jgi:pimeloyl-ACP methyl ester carboxylesterase
VERSFVSHIHDLACRADLPDPLTVYGSSFEFQSDTWNPLGISNAEMLARLDTRALILWGGHSLLPQSEATRLAGHLPSTAAATVAVVEQAGHWLPLYRPRQTVDPVLEFLGRIAGFESSSAATLVDRR